MLGPLHLDGVAEAEGAQAAVAVGARQGALEAHVGQLAHRPRREPVAAGLLPRELLLLHDHHVPAGVGQPEGARGPRGPGADDDHVVHVLGAGRAAARRRRRGVPPGAASWGPSWRRLGCAGVAAFLAAALPRASPSWPPPASWPGLSPSSPPSSGRRARGSRREPSRGHRRSAAGASDQRRGCAWRRGHMVETEHQWTSTSRSSSWGCSASPSPSSRSCPRPCWRRGRSPPRPSWRPTSAASSPTSSRRSASRCASTWSR